MAARICFDVFGLSLGRRRQPATSSRLVLVKQFTERAEFRPIVSSAVICVPVSRARETGMSLGKTICPLVAVPRLYSRQPLDDIAQLRGTGRELADLRSQ